MDAIDETAINAFLKISRICGVFPPKKHSRLFYIYQVLIFGFTLFFGVFSTYCMVSRMLMTDSSLDIFVNILIFIINVILGLSMQYNTIFCPEEWRNFYENLKIGCNKTKLKQNYMILEVLIINIFFFTRFFVFEYLVFTLFGMEVVIENLFIQLIDYYSIIFLMIVVHINFVIKKKFLLMNCFLRSTRSIRRIQEYYAKTIQLLDIFNHLFGYQIICLIARAIGIILQFLHYGLKLNNAESNANVYIHLFFGFYSLTIYVIKMYKKVTVLSQIFIFLGTSGGFNNVMR